MRKASKSQTDEMASEVASMALGLAISNSFSTGNDSSSREDDATTTSDVSSAPTPSASSTSSYSPHVLAISKSQKDARPTEVTSMALGLAISDSFSMICGLSEDDDVAVALATGKTSGVRMPSSRIITTEKRYLDAAEGPLKFMGGVRTTNSRAKITFDESESSDDEDCEHNGNACASKEKHEPELGVGAVP